MARFSFFHSIDLGDAAFAVAVVKGRGSGAFTLDVAAVILGVAAVVVPVVVPVVIIVVVPVIAVPVVAVAASAEGAALAGAGSFGLQIRIPDHALFFRFHRGIQGPGGGHVFLREHGGIDRLGKGIAELRIGRE